MRSIETTAAKLSVFKMTWPIFIEILLQMMVGNVDQFMLSHYSQKSVAAVGNANQIINIVIIALSVISMRRRSGRCIDPDRLRVPAGR